MKKETIIENFQSLKYKNAFSGEVNEDIIKDFLFDTIKEVILDFKIPEDLIEQTKKSFGKIGEMNGEMLENFNNYIENKAREEGLI